MRSAAEISDLIGKLYEAGGEPALWPGALEEIARAVGGAVAAVFLHDRALAEESELLATSGYPAYVQDAYKAHYAERDVRMPTLFGRAQGAVSVDDHNMAFAVIEKSEIHNDLYRPLRIGHGMATLLFAERARVGALSVHRDIKSGGFRDQEIALFEILAPHAVRAFQFQRQAARARAVARSLRIGLDHFPMAVLLVDGEGRIIEMNGAAEAMLGDRACPLRAGSGRLTTGRSDTSASLARAIKAATDARNIAGPPPPILRLLREDDGDALGIMAVPVGETCQCTPDPNRLALLFVAEPVRRKAAEDVVLGAELGLSPAEARIAALLAAGKSIHDIADQKGLSRETIRVHVKRVLSKTGCRTQAQLVGQVAGSLASLRRGRE